MKELSKFLSGVFAFLAVDHATLFFCNELPLTFCGTTITQNSNTVLLFGSAAISVVLIYVAWIRKPKMR